jgi:hypothetical protein
MRFHEGIGSGVAGGWSIALVFLVTSVSMAYGEMLLWGYEGLVAVGILAFVYILASLRFFPWKTPLRKAFSVGVLVGISVTVVFWRFGIELTPIGRP